LAVRLELVPLHSLIWELWTEFKIVRWIAW